MEDYTERGKVWIETVRRRTYGPFQVDRGTYKNLLSQWETGLTGDIITVTLDSGQEHNYRRNDVTAIDWKPGE